MDEVSACRDLEHVDIAAELHVFRALFSGSLHLILAFRRPDVQALDGREWSAVKQSNDHARSGLTDLRECHMLALMLAEIPSVSIGILGSDI